MTKVEVFSSAEPKLIVMENGRTLISGNWHCNNLLHAGWAYGKMEPTKGASHAVWRCFSAPAILTECGALWLSLYASPAEYINLAVPYWIIFIVVLSLL